MASHKVLLHRPAAETYAAYIGDTGIPDDSEKQTTRHLYLCDAVADLPTYVGVQNGDWAFVLADSSQWKRSGGTWTEIVASGGAPTNVDYLVGTASGSLSAEIVVGTAPGGELGGTWASPTVDATHSGSAHHAQSHGNADHTSTFITATGVTYENLDANGDVGTIAGTVAIGNHTHAGGAPPSFFDVIKWGTD